MRKIAENEIMSINKLLQMETNGLALSKATIKMMEDSELRSMTEAGIKSAEARIKSLNQFIGENNIVNREEVH